MSLRFVRGGRAPITIGPFTIHVSSDDEPLPFVVDALVVEQDRWCSLAATSSGLAPCSEVLRTMTQAHDAAPLELGSVEVRAGNPTVLRAIVIDVDDEPCCRPASIARATATCVRTCRERRLDRLRLPLLGTEKGRLDRIESAKTIFDALLAVAGERGHLEIVLIVPATLRADVQGIGERAAFR